MLLRKPGAKTDLFDSELLIRLYVDLSSFLSGFLRDEGDLRQVIRVAAAGEKGGTEGMRRTILFISDWISLSLRAPRDMLGEVY